MRVIFALHAFSFTFREAKYIVPKVYRIRRIYRAEGLSRAVRRRRNTADLYYIAFFIHMYK